MGAVTAREGAAQPSGRVRQEKGGAEVEGVGVALGVAGGDGVPLGGGDEATVLVCVGVGGGVGGWEGVGERVGEKVAKGEGEGKGGVQEEG